MSEKGEDKVLSEKNPDMENKESVTLSVGFKNITMGFFGNDRNIAIIAVPVDGLNLTFLRGFLLDAYDHIAVYCAHRAQTRRKIIHADNKGRFKQFISKFR